MIILQKHTAAIVLTLAASIGGSSLAASGIEVGPNIQVNSPQQNYPHDFPTRSTISITVSSDGQRLLAGFEDYQGLCGPPAGGACPVEDPSGLSGFSFSADGGRT